MKRLFSYSVIMSFLFGCQKDEFENQAIDVPEYGTAIIELDSVYEDLCVYPYQYLLLDGTINDSAAAYLWLPGGETTPILEVSKSEYGVFTLIRTTSTYVDSSIARVNFACEPNVYIPNSFSPNNWKNDVWKPVFGGLPQHYQSIYWEVRDQEGLKIFSTTNIKEGWDGEYQNVSMHSGFYLYYINYSTLTTENNILTGSLELIR